MREYISHISSELITVWAQELWNQVLAIASDRKTIITEISTFESVLMTPIICNLQSIITEVSCENYYEYS